MGWTWLGSLSALAPYLLVQSPLQDRGAIKLNQVCEVKMYRLTIFTQAKHLVKLFKLCQLFQLLQLPKLHCNSYSLYVLVRGAKV